MRLQCMVTRTRALHARVTIFFAQGFNRRDRAGEPVTAKDVAARTACPARRRRAAYPARSVESTAARQLSAFARWSLRKLTH